MFIFVAGIVVGLLVVLSRDFLHAANPDAARAVQSMGSFGYFLALNSAMLGFIYTRMNKPGVAGARARRLQWFVAAMTVPIALIPLYGVAPFCSYGSFRVIWNWLLGGAVLLVLIWWRVSPIGRTCLDVEEHPETRCHHCGYTLTREQQRCPECGTPRCVREEPPEEDDTT